MTEKKGKILVYCRHLDTSLSAEKNFQMIWGMNLGRKKFSYSFTGVEKRSQKTMEMIRSTFPVLVGNAIEYGQPIEQIGSDELFGQMFTSEVLQTLDSGNHHIASAFEAAHGINQLSDWCVEASKGVDLMIGMLNNGEKGLAVGHSPIINLAAYALTGHFVVMRPLDLLVFIQREGELLEVDFYPHRNPLF